LGVATNNDRHTLARTLDVEIRIHLQRIATDVIFARTDLDKVRIRGGCGRFVCANRIQQGRATRGWVIESWLDRNDCRRRRSYRELTGLNRKQEEEECSHPSTIGCLHAFHERILHSAPMMRHLQTKHHQLTVNKSIPTVPCVGDSKVD
jgi:hypothetical protein